MLVKDVVGRLMGSSDYVVKAYIADLSPEELVQRPADGMNCIAWQLGHLISSEKGLGAMIKPGAHPDLPVGFEDAHSKDAAKSDDTSKYLSREGYLEAWDAQRKATLEILESVSEEELNAAPPSTLNGMCPTKADIFNFIGAHTLMHVGQFVPVRRAGGKPIVI